VKAWEIRDRFGIEQLVLADRETGAPGPGQARVAWQAFSLNYRDVMMIDGRYNPRQPLPLVPLSDAAGIVDAVGDGVSRVKVGDRVMAIFAQRWIAGALDREKQSSALGGPRQGVAAESSVLDAEGLVHVPRELSFEEAAALPCAAVTAWSALFEHGALAPGQTVLIQGTGGVSIFALQFAALAGATAIVTSKSDEKLERARALGARHTINYARDRDGGKSARALTSNAGVDHVVDVGGAGTIDGSFAAVKPGGTISVIGVLDGVEKPIALTRLLMNDVRLQGVFVGSRDAFERMTRAIEANGLRPVVDRAFAFEELPQALAHMQGGAHFGKIVLRK
jgi:NADPH:quinone reductase-like Zn-dependent oxidoreductase